MAILRAFKGIRPLEQYAAEVASRPYDVLNRSEARKEAEGRPHSFLHVIKPEIDLPDEIDEHDDAVYRQGIANFSRMLSEGVMMQDETPCLYVYAQTMAGRTQYGIVGCAAVQDYLDEVIRKHELTRPDKEEDRRKHIRLSGYNYEPVFFAYPAVDEIDAIVSDVTSARPVYDFVAEDGIAHRFWVISRQDLIGRLVALFAKIPSVYVADGHHRTAAAAGVGQECRLAAKHPTGEEEYNFFLTVLFPDNQLKIFDYNRVIKDLNGMTPEEFLNALSSVFDIECRGTEPVRPERLHQFGLYLGGRWYALQAKPGTYHDDDPIGCLDVTVLSETVLTPLLDITDLRKSKRIDFVGGIRGLEELERRVDSGEMQAAFALYPVSMKQLIDIADSGMIMPPKTTWFEPKLRSGLVVHSLEIR